MVNSGRCFFFIIGRMEQFIKFSFISQTIFMAPLLLLFNNENIKELLLSEVEIGAPDNIKYKNSYVEPKCALYFSGNK